MGKPLDWEDALPYLNYVREHGVLQFLVTYEALQGLVKPELKWGEEMEVGIFRILPTDDNPHKKQVLLSLRAEEIRAALVEKELEQEDRFEGCTWQPEFGSWFVNQPPTQPPTHPTLAYSTLFNPPLLPFYTRQDGRIYSQPSLW